MVTRDESGEVLCQGPSLPAQSPCAHSGLSGLRLDLCLKNRPGLLLSEVRHIKRASSPTWPSRITHLCSSIHPWAYDELITI